MKKRLKEIEEEAGVLREMQGEVEKEMGPVQGISFNFEPISKPHYTSMYILLLIFLLRFTSPGGLEM
ncbi:hypothetical protein HanRHA438_Chr11g0528941 [Helianthus annuus]|uniref:Uncharacterized protein n=1 Tax=Helianthus annuus TaxID=4232 RepID=A0A9K3HT84_HELAN|nr:hypothetical protein HanXRQr2_Chr11g0517231 [Helianthus annuus]KAJ0503452.1 hypothetical protein HanHA300_Chr11g0424381 [Helianthus annuus]KAJ0511802.1 hypothetical protein HanIR_Chr11g0556111 [Helianthus annuus]KAJ0519408.1 hypothetical protein HanHA89_Chr11g0448411 [Helianthus annuus]KAJ0687412.1 hypothetical protein HanLR1_Chr11g0425761 [Helianthus annuus]